MAFLPLFIFIFGTIVGSFLNVVIFRLNTGRSVVTGRSKCATCSRTLHWHDLIPVWSYIALRGRCRTCKRPISPQYPVIELLTAILFLGAYLYVIQANGFGLAAFVELFFAMLFISLSIVIVAYDIRHKIIPDVPIRIALVASMLLIFAKYFLGIEYSLGRALLAGPLVALPFFLLWYLSKGRWMGFGDVKIALVLGWIFGLLGGFSAIIISFWIGGLFGLFLLALSSRHHMKSQVPFAPFLIVGALAVYFFDISVLKLLTPW